MANPTVDPAATPAAPPPITDPFETQAVQPSVIKDPFEAAPAIKDPFETPSPSPSPSGNMLTDVWPEIKSAAATAAGTIADTLNPFSEARHRTYAKAAAEPTFMGGLSDIAGQTLDTGKGLTAIPELVAAPFITGPARSLIGHPLASAEHLIGKLINPSVAAKDNPEEMYQHAKGDVDTALSGLMPARGGLRTLVKPLPAPTPPATGPFGVTLSEGEATGDLAKRGAEQRLIRSGDPVANQFLEQRSSQLAQAPLEAAPKLDPAGHTWANSSVQAADRVDNALQQQQALQDASVTANEQALIGAHETFRQRLSPTWTTLAQTPLDAADHLSWAIDNEAQKVQSAKNAAYAAANELPGQFHPASFNTIEKEITSTLSNQKNPTFIDPQRTPLASAAVDDLGSILSDLKQVRDPDTGQILPKPPLTPERIDIARQRLNTYLGNALQSARANPSGWMDVNALRDVIDAFDNSVNKRFADGRFIGGDPQAVLDAFANARKLNTQYRRTFTPQGPGDTVGQAIQKIIGRYDGQAATPEQVQQMMYGPGALPVQIAKRLQTMFGETSPEFGAARQGLYSYLTERPAGASAWGPEKVADRIDQFTKGPGRTLTQTYLSPDEINALKGQGARLRQHAQSVEDAVNPFEGTDWQATFRQVVNGNQKAVSQVDVALSRLGATSPVASEMRQGIFFNALQPIAGVEKWGVKQKADNLASLLQATRNSKLYAPEHRQVIQSYIDMLRKLEVPKGMYEPSGPAIDRLKLGVEQGIGQMIGYTIAHHIPGAGLAMDLVGMRLGREGASFLARKNINKVRAQLPLVSEQMQKYQKALAIYNKSQNPLSTAAITYAGANLSRSLASSGIKLNPAQLQLPGLGTAAPGNQPAPKRADGGPLPDANFPPFEGELHYTTEGYPYYQAPSGLETAPEGVSPPGASPLAPNADKTPSEAPGPIADVPGVGPVATGADTDYGNRALNRLTGAGGEERYQTWPEKMIRSGTTLAGDVLSGAEPDYTGMRREDFTDLPPPDANSPREGGFWPFNKLTPVAAEPQDALIGRTQDMAALAGGAGIPNAEEGAVGVFGGQLAKGADLRALAQAKNLFRQGASRDDIWTKTGWFQGKDGQWRFEIPDDALKVSSEGITHKPLQQAYPALKNVDVSVTRDTQPFGSFTREPPDYIKELSPKDANANAKIAVRGPKGEQRSIAAHELQHFVQDQEDFHPGGSPYGSMLSRFADPNEAYTRLVGEVEARNVEKRLAMSPEERRAIPPWKTQDYADSKQLLTKNPNLLSDTSKPGAALSALEKSPPFYSAVEQALTNAPQQKMQASQWAGWLKNQPGVKAEELNHLGLDKPETFPSQGLVNKTDLLNHVKENNVQLGEVEKKGTSFTSDDVYDEARRRTEEEHPELQLDSEEYHRVLNDYADELKNEIKEGGVPKYSDYQLPGGENYRELLLTMPTNKPTPVVTVRQQPGGWGTYVDGERAGMIGDSNHNFTIEQARQIAAHGIENSQAWRNSISRGNEGGFRSSHWDEPNVVGHLRMNDREIPGVGKTLHIEEAQSDLHQKGRKQGYVGDGPDPATLERAALVPYQKLEASIREMYPTYSNSFVRDRTQEFIDSVEHNQTTKGFTPEQHDLARQYNEAWDKYREATVAGHQSKVPNFPFKQSWPDLLLKRAITKAAREGKDAISWTPGEQQAARYDLSKQVKKLNYRKRDADGTYDLWGELTNGAEHRFGNAIPADKLVDYVGKDVAEKIAASKSGGGVLEGPDLKVGGEGMKSFYDSMLVAKANAIGKKYGAKVEWKPLNDKSFENLTVEKTHDGYTILDHNNKEYGNYDTEDDAVHALAVIERRSGTDKSLKVPVLRLTPQLKEAAAKGLPLFSDTTKPGAALSGLEHGNLPQTMVLDKPKLSAGVQNFLQMAQPFEQKYGTNWPTKLSPQELQTIRSNPTYTNALATIQKANDLGVFNQVLAAPTSRRELFGKAARVATMVANASRLAKVFEASQALAPNIAGEALQKIGALPSTFGAASKEVMNNYYKAERNLRDAQEAERNRVASAYASPLETAAKQEARNRFSAFSPSELATMKQAGVYDPTGFPPLSPTMGDLAKLPGYLSNKVFDWLRTHDSATVQNSIYNGALERAAKRRGPSTEELREKLNQELAALDTKYQPQLDSLHQDMMQKHQQLEAQFGQQVELARQQLNLPKLSPEQQKVLDYVVHPGGGLDNFVDATLQQNPYELQRAESILESLKKHPEQEAFYKDEVPYLLAKMSPEQKAQIAEHIKPALLQDPHLSLRDVRTIVKAFPSLKGFALFSDTGIGGLLGQQRSRDKQNVPGVIAKQPDTREPTNPQKRAAGGRVNGRADGGAVNYDTPLTPDEESKFQDWKAKNAPNDSGVDYDLRGAFKANMSPAENGHWDDTFKKPNHPTFSVYSQYAKDRPDLAGTWEGDQYVPPVTAHYANGGIVARAHGGRVNPDNINHNPSEAQKRSGTYAKDHVNIHGLNITIENARGSIRRGVDKDGNKWEAKLSAHYGYLRKQSLGADGDHLDVYLGPHMKSKHVYLIDQLDADTGKYDEAKIILGAANLQQALRLYKAAFSDGKGHARIGAIHSMTIAELKSYLEHGNTKVPYKPPLVKKLSHKEVNYEPKAQNMAHRCAKCKHFVPVQHGGPDCVVTAKPIAPQGWCNRFRGL